MARVVVQTVEAVCRKSEDTGWLGSHDELYIAGAVTGGTTTTPVLTDPLSIDDGQTLPLPVSCLQPTYQMDLPYGFP